MQKCKHHPPWERVPDCCILPWTKCSWGDWFPYKMALPTISKGSLLVHPLISYLYICTPRVLSEYYLYIQWVSEGMKITRKKKNFLEKNCKTRPFCHHLPPTPLLLLSLWPFSVSQPSPFFWWGQLRVSFRQTRGALRCLAQNLQWPQLIFIFLLIND